MIFSKLRQRNYRVRNFILNPVICIPYGTIEPFFPLKLLSLHQITNVPLKTHTKVKIMI